MQTFLPYRDFELVAKCLDYRRLGKQRVECLQVLRTLYGDSAGWKNHPAVKMWRHCESSLIGYGIAICNEWIARGYVDNTKPRIMQYGDATFQTPEWVTHDLCLSHQSNLVRKLPEYYKPLFPDVPDNIPYVWPL